MKNDHRNLLGTSRCFRILSHWTGPALNKRWPCGPRHLNRPNNSCWVLRVYSQCLRNSNFAYSEEWGEWNLCRTFWRGSGKPDCFPKRIPLLVGQCLFRSRLHKAAECCKERIEIVRGRLWNLKNIYVHHTTLEDPGKIRPTRYTSALIVCSLAARFQAYATLGSKYLQHTTKKSSRSQKRELGSTQVSPRHLHTAHAERPTVSTSARILGTSQRAQVREKRRQSTWEWSSFAAPDETSGA